MNEQERASLWRLLEGPARLLAYGLAGLLLVLAFQFSGVFDALGRLFTFGSGDKASNERIATLVFLVGLGFAAFLWWLCSRYFQLLRESQADGASVIASLKDLPMALPEGTVRAIIALIVGVVGLPLLVYSKSLNLSDAVAGYVNGIIIGVFSYYFGSRSSGADAQTTRQTVKLLDQAQADKQQLAQQVGALGGAVEQAKAELDSTVQQSGFERELGRLQRQVGAAQVLVEQLGPALPSGLIPDGAADLLKKAQLALATAQTLKGGSVTAATVGQVAETAEALLGKSPLTALLKTAAGAMPVLSGLPPVAGVVLMLGVAWRLGSDQYKRWVARVLDAPYDPQLISLGLITPTSAQIALEQCPVLCKAFPAAERQVPAFVSQLLDDALREDAADRLWQRWGADASRFGSRGELEQGLAEFRRALLWDQSSDDVTAPQIAETLAPLANTALAALTPPPPQALNDAMRRMAQHGASTVEQRSAMEALIMWVGQMRLAKLDPAQLIAEAWRP